MKKTFCQIFSLILLVFVNGCVGYEPIFGSTNLQFEITDYSIEGNKILGNKIFSKLHSSSKSRKDDQNLRSIDLIIKVSKDKNSTVKDSAGKILEYKISLKTEVKVKDFITDKNILNHTFVYSLTYNVQDQHSETVKLENKSTEIMINNTYQELLVKLTQSI